MFRIFDYGTLVIAFTTSLLLLALICFKTPTVMKSYQPVLLCGWFADFTYNIGCFIGRPLYLYKNGVMYMTSNMFSSIIRNDWFRFTALILFIYGFMQLMVMPALQFFARYLMVVWNIQLKTRSLLFLLIALYFFPISYSILVYVACFDPTFYEQKFDPNASENDTFGRRFDLACDINTNLMNFVSVYAFFQIFLTYGLISFFGWKIYGKLKVGINQPKMQRVQKQITNILLVQALTPPFMGGIPLIYVFTMLIFKFESHPLAVKIFDRFIAVVPIVNPILAIYFVKHYREAVLKALCCCFAKRHHGNKVTSAQMTTASRDEEPNSSNPYLS